MNPELCPECGAPVPEGGSCQDNFNALLVLEGEVPGAPGTIVHFYTVACYVLQHPDSMGFTRETLSGLRQSLADALEARVDLQELRRRAGAAAAGSNRVKRREGDPAPDWHRGAWPMTVAHMLEAGADGYAERVVAWARVIRRTLEDG